MAPKKGAFMAKGRHRGFAGQLPQTAPPDPPLSPATEAWRTALRLLKFEPHGHLTWLGWLHPGLTI